MRIQLICMTLVSLLAATCSWSQAPAVANDTIEAAKTTSDAKFDKSAVSGIKQLREKGASDQNLRNPGVCIYPGLKAWIDETKTPWCAVLCIHGLTLHKDSYARLANRTSEMGIATYAMDVRGFGDFRNIPGKDKFDIDGTFDDIEHNLLAIRSKYPTLPVFVLGESMGGAIALQASAKFPHLVDGTLSSVPHANARGKAILKGMAVFAKGIIKGPNAEVDVEMLAKDFTNQPKLKDKVVNDPRVRTKITVAELVRVSKMMHQNKKYAPHLSTMPIVILQGWKDKLMRPNDSIDIMNRMGTPNKDLVVVGQNEHLILEEGQYTDYVMDSVLSWMDKASSNSPIVTPSEMIRPNEIVHQHKPDEEVFRLLRIAQTMMRMNDNAKATEYRERAEKIASRGRTPQELAAWFNSLPPQLVVPITGPGTEQIFVRSGLQVAPDSQNSPVILLFTDSRMNEKRPNSAKLYSRFKDHPDILTIDVSSAEGAQIAKSYGLLAAPAALLLDSNRVVRDVLVSRSDKELRIQLNNSKVAVAHGRFISM